MDVVLFGAGEYGVQALKYYGADKVSFFIDNNNDKVGLELCGKTVIGFDEFMRVKNEYAVIISSYYYLEMSEQLKNNGINNYGYYSPAYSKAVDYVVHEIKKHVFKNIIIYGADANTEFFISKIKKRLKGDSHYAFHKIANTEKYFYPDESRADCDVSLLEKKDYIQNCFIIGTEYYHAAYYLRLRQLVGEKGVIINPFQPRAFYDTDDIVVNPYKNDQIDCSEKQYIEKTKKNDIIAKIDAYFDIAVKMSPPPLFKLVEIETFNRCNGVCDFCPVNKKVDSREKKVMGRELFDNIIGQLKDMDYRGGLSLFSNNEPLLDERILALSKYARESLPGARIHMCTNGTLFTIDKFKELILYLDELIIDNYRQDLNLIESCREIVEYVERHEELRRKVTVVLRKPKEILTTRGGDAPNRKNKISFENAKCVLPFQQLVIRPDGKISLCCNDALGRNTLGDLNKETILDVWYGEKYAEAREALSHGRKNWEQCRFCDTFGFY